MPLPKRQPSQGTSAEQLSDHANASTSESPRDRVISAIYETVLRPELYDDFMDAWSDHVLAALDDLSQLHETESDTGRLMADADLAGHFRRAFEILEQMGRKIDAEGGPFQVGAGVGIAIMLNARAEVLHASAQAKDLLGSEDASAALFNRLSPASASLLQGLLGDAAAGRLGDPLVLSCEAAPRHLIARVISQGNGQFAVTVEALDVNWSNRTRKALETSFGLSPAELEIVRHIAAGQSLKAIAAEICRSEHTVRNQMKAVLGKTGVAGQVELMRLVAVLASSEAVATQVDTKTAKTQSDESQMVRLNGRLTQVIELGDPKGRPFLYLHSILDLMGGMRLHEARLRERGLRAIVPIRPGYGHSQPWPKSETAVDQVSDDLAQLLDRLEIEKLPAFGHMGGALYAHGLAHHHPERLTGLLCVAGAVPIREIKQISGINARQRVVGLTARFAAPLLPPILRAGIAQIDTSDLNEFLDALYPSSTADAAAIRRLGIAPLLHSEYRMAVHQGHFGFAMDSHHLVRDWSEHVRGHHTRTIHLHGALDKVMQVKYVKEFARLHNHIEMRVLEDVGQFILYVDPATVLDALEDLLEPG